MITGRARYHAIPFSSKASLRRSRIASDLHDLSFSNHDRTAQQNYAAERLADIEGDEGPILIETSTEEGRKA